MSAGPDRVLVLGHTGFIGRHVFDHLQSTLAGAGTAIFGWSSKQADLADARQAARLAPHVGPWTDVVMCSAIQKWVDDSAATFSRNVAMVLNLLEMLASSPPRQLVFFSSAAVYGEEVSRSPITEDAAVSPSTYYGASKFAAECLLQLWAQSHPQTALCILRPPLVYGSDNPESQYLPRQFAASILRGEPVTLWGDGTEIRNFIHVDDVARTVVRIVRDMVPGLYNLSSPYNLSYRAFAELIADAAGRPVRLVERQRTRPKVDLPFGPSRLALKFVGEQLTPPALAAKRIVEDLSK